MGTRLKVLSGIFVIILMALPAWSQQTATLEDMPGSLGVIQGNPYDWTHRHIVFSNPSDSQTFDRVTRDPRFWMQKFHRGMLRTSVQESSALRIRAAKPTKPPAGGTPLNVDWSQALNVTVNPNAGTEIPVFPAKFSFNANGFTLSCTNDYAVFTVPD